MNASALTDEQLNEIEQRAEAASEAPWVAKKATAVISEDGRAVAMICDWDDYEQESWDAEFIAHGREDVELLVAALRAERRELEYARILLEESVDLANGELCALDEALRAERDTRQRVEAALDAAERGHRPVLIAEFRAALGGSR